MVLLARWMNSDTFGRFAHPSPSPDPAAAHSHLFTYTFFFSYSVNFCKEVA
jgi:hypothetical protein